MKAISVRFAVGIGNLGIKSFDLNNKSLFMGEIKDPTITEKDKGVLITWIDRDGLRRSTLVAWSHVIDIMYDAEKPVTNTK